MSKVCLNHPDREATDRCTACFKPLCDECVVIHNGDSYCSEECISQAVRTTENINSFKQAEKRSKFRRLISRLLKFVIFIGIAAGIVYFLMKKGIIKF